MSTLASRTFTARLPVEGGRGLSALRTERSIALIRVTVLAVVVTLYLSRIGIRSSLGPPALVILAMACVYAFACLLWIARDEVVSFWTLYLIVVASVGLRFGMIETLGVAAGLAILHVSVLMGAEGVEPTALIYLPALLVVVGFAVGVLSYQRSVQRRERRA